MLQASISCALYADRTYVLDVGARVRAGGNGCGNERRARVTRTSNGQVRRARAGNTRSAVGAAQLLLSCCSVAFRLVLGCCSVAARLLLGRCSAAARLLLGRCLAAAWLLLGGCSTTLGEGGEVKGGEAAEASRFGGGEEVAERRVQRRQCRRRAGEAGEEGGLWRRRDHVGRKTGWRGSAIPNFFGSSALDGMRAYGFWVSV